MLLLRGGRGLNLLKLSSTSTSTTTSTSTSTNSGRRASSTFSPLPSRAALSLTGQDASSLLQGLVTNDLRHLDDRLEGGPQDLAQPNKGAAKDKNAIYSMFLNVQGRILYDVIVFSDLADRDRLVVDCHRDVAAKLAKHLKMYRLKKKVDIQIMEGANCVALFDDGESSEKPPKFSLPLLQGTVFSVDPRLSQLGHRFVLPEGADPDKVFGKSMGKSQESDYDRLRFRLGVSEGPHEIPPAKCFPLEYNADYLHGVSFHKGCYIGQELTARVKHTGVVRKRIVPVKLEQDLQDDVEFDSNFVDEKGKRVGKLRSKITDNMCLGLMRIEECQNAQEIRLNGVKAKAEIPDWWPKPAPKKRT